jgi:hypothetical protein
MSIGGWCPGFWTASTDPTLLVPSGPRAVLFVVLAGALLVREVIPQSVTPSPDLTPRFERGPTRILITGSSRRLGFAIR